MFRPAQGPRCCGFASLGGHLGEGIPMWNGFWKLTVMVGVIGVGLFAVYQAQQGMNRVASLQPEQEPGEAVEPDPSAEVIEPETDGDHAPTSVSIHRIDQDRSAPKKKRPTDTYDDDRIDLVGRFNPDQATVKTAKGTKKPSVRQVAEVDPEPRPRGLSFRDNVELVDLDNAGEEPEDPQALPDDGLAETGTVLKSRKKAPTAVEEVESEPPATSAPAAAFDPFDEDSATTSTAESTDSTDEDSAISAGTEPDTDAKAGTEVRNPTPSKAVIHFGEETDIPRSKRATLGKEKKPEPTAVDAPAFQETPDETTPENDSPAETDAQSVERETTSDNTLPEKSLPAVDMSETETSTGNDELANDAPPSFDELATDAAVGEKTETLKSQGSSVPAPESDPMPALGSPASEGTGEPPALFDEEDETVKSPPPARKRMTLPGLSVEPSQEEPERSAPARGGPALESFERDVPNKEVPGREPFQARESTKRLGDPEGVSPGDLVGDGIAGDPSQRGVQQPRLTIEKVAQHQAVIDQPLIYTIIVRNTGTVVAHNVVVEDRIPKGTELMGTSPRAELVGKRLIWNELVLKPNEEKKISIKVIPKQEGPIGSVARLYFATEVSAEIQVATPQLEFTLKAPQEVRPGQTIDLVFHLKNIGTVDASNITVRDLIPENFKHEEGTDIECAIGKLSPNEVREIVLPITAMTTGAGINRAVLTADSGIKKELDQTINVVGEVLVLTRSGQSRVYVSRPTTFTSTIRNDGNLRVANVRVAEVVPAGMEFETASEGGRYDARQRAVFWTLGPLGPGDDRAVSVKYVPKETGTHVGKITATGASGSTASVDSTVEVVGRPELQMESLSTTGVVTVGDRISSKMQLKNSGTASARNVRLSLRLPPELRLVEVRGRKFQQQDDRVIFETIEELPPRGNVAFELMLEPIQEAEARIQLEIAAEHLSKPHRRDETIQIVQDVLK